MTRIQSIRNTPYRLRTQGRCARMKLIQLKRKVTTQVFIVMALSYRTRCYRLYNILLLLALISYDKYMKNKFITYVDRRFVGNNFINFEGISYHDSWHHLRFKKKDLWRISESLLLPLRRTLDNGAVVNNEEMLLILFYRLRSCDSWISLEKRIGIEYSRMSRIFKVCLIDLYQLNYYLLLFIIIYILY